MKNRSYSKEFKEQAVRLSYQRDNLKDLANELGIQVNRIYDWRKKYPYLSPEPSSLSEDAEVKLLRKQLKDKELELEILKKAIHIFSKKDGSSTNL